MLLPLLLLLSKFFGLLGLFSPPDGFPLRIFLLFFVLLLLRIELVNGKLGLLIEGNHTDDRGGLRGDWHHGVGGIGGNGAPNGGCNRMQLFDLRAYLGCKE